MVDRSQIERVVKSLEAGSKGGFRKEADDSLDGQAELRQENLTSFNPGDAKSQADLVGDYHTLHAV